MLIFAGLTEPLGRDPEWARFEARLRLFPFYRALDAMQTFAAAAAPPIRRMLAAFKQANDAYARIAKVLVEAQR